MANALKLPGGLAIAGTEVITAGRVLQNVTANASIINAGTFHADRIPDLAASKIGSGTFHSDRLSGAYSEITGLGTQTTDLLFLDATYDIGKSGATRPRDGFFSRNVGVGGALAVDGTSTLSGDVIVSTIRRGTADGADSSQLTLAGGGGPGTDRGANIALYGNESGGSGLVLIRSGELAGAHVDTYTGSTSTRRTRVTDGGVLIVGSGVSPGSATAGGIRTTGSSDFAALRATRFATAPAATVATTSGVPATIHTCTAAGRYEVTTWLADAGLNYMSTAQVVFDGSNAWPQDVMNGPASAISLSGAAIQVTQTTGSAQNMSYTVLLMA